MHAQLQVESLWREVQAMQKSQAELQHRTSAAEQAAQLLVGAAQRERAASAAAAAEVLLTFVLNLQAPAMELNRRRSAAQARRLCRCRR